MATQTQEIEIFSTGMTTDLRKIIRVNRRILRPFQSLQHFDVYPDRLVPKRDWANETSAFALANVTQFVHYVTSTGVSRLYALGLTSGTFPTIIANTLGTYPGSWTGLLNGVSGSAAGFPGNPWLFAYKDYLYYMSNSGLNRYNLLTAVNTGGYQALAVGSTDVSNVRPVVHPRTGAAYFFNNNNVYMIDPTGTWVGVVQTLPSDRVITSASPYGNYLAIGSRSTSMLDHSFTYLWDLSVTSSPTSINFGEAIDWGAGDLRHLGQINGRLIGITDEYLGGQNYNLNKGRMVSRVYAGSTAQETNYLTTDNSINSGRVEAVSFTDGVKLYFAAEFPFKGVYLNGVWSIDQNGSFLLEMLPPIAEAGNRIVGIYRVGNAWYLAFSSGNVYRTNDQTSFLQTAIMETAVYGDRLLSSQFVGATVSFEKLSNGQSVSLFYKLPEDTSWQSMGTQNKAGERQLQLLGTTAKVAPRLLEYQFRVESVGATITGLSWTTEPYDTNIYG